MNNTIKLRDRNPNFNFVDLLDDFLDHCGGILEILHFEWNEINRVGFVACLMKDWRVFKYYLITTDLSGLTNDAKIAKISTDCVFFEDIDDFNHWFEMNDVDDLEKLFKNQKEKEKKLEQEEKDRIRKLDSLKSFFDGDLDAVVNEMTRREEEPPF